jgi:hypothetical protein
MRLLLSCFLLFISFGVQAQFTYVLDQSIPVENDKATLTMPWVGGLNTAQYNTMDLNEDNQEDLVLFDRMTNKIFTFLNLDNQYVYAPEYEPFFPSDVANWILLRDLNCDGRKDIFTGNILGIKVYTNETQSGETLTWKHHLFYDDGNKSDVLLTKGFSEEKINLQLQYDDLPTITDADGDGDLDIFTVRFAGNGTIEYHKNYGLERNNNNCDSLDFERITMQWGGFTECSCGNFAFDNEACPTGGRVEHAGGKSLLMLDVTQDGQLDVLLSEATCTRLSFLENKGDLLNPVVNSDESFPTTNASNFLYPAPYYEDVDFDGLKDLIITPNIFTKTSLNTNLAMSNWVYKNSGTNDKPVFTYSTANFLQDRMIDVGDNAVPAFADFDADGDYDLFVSQNTSDVTAATIQVYENTGSQSSPSFKLFEDNYLNFTTLALYNLKIQFTDISGDGKQDLVFTATGFFDGVTRLNYIPNKAAAGLSFSIGDIQTIDINPAITTELASTENILVIDIDLDGKKDLLHGRSNGAIYYWKNSGNNNAPSYTLTSETYLGIGSSVLRQNLSFATGDLNGNGTNDLVIGDQTGELRILENFRQGANADAAVSNIVWNPLSETYQTRNLGGRIWPAIVNLFGTTQPAIVTGNVTGGLTVLKHDNSVELPAKPVVAVYPNPVLKGGSLSVQSDRPVSMQIFSSTGQIISQSILIQPNQSNQISDVRLSAGLYILRFVWDNQSFAKKIVVH